MGILTSKFIPDLRSAGYLSNSRKRKHSEDSDSDGDIESEIDPSQHASKKKRTKKKLLSTALYIYQALFKEGIDSDVTLIALGKEWKLHKVYLCQSPYFASMFSGSWKEANENTINIEIVDSKITKDSLYTVLGSLYFNELELEPEPGQLVPVLATAALFQLESLSERCAEVMIETLDVGNVLSYYDAGVEYGVTSVKEAAFNWLLMNLLTFIRHIPEVLSQISVNLMAELLSSPNLFVIQSDSSIYHTLQTWLYYILNPDFKRFESMHQVVNESSKYFRSIYNGTEYLLTKEGKKYESPFRALKIEHLIHFSEDLERLRNDRIVPSEWINKAVTDIWVSLLQFDHCNYTGPKDCKEEDLNLKGLRFGRMLNVSGEHVWRWTGFYCGLDLVWIWDNHCLKVRRNHREADITSMLSMHKRRSFAVRVTIAKVNKQRQTEYLEKSEIQILTLLKHEEAVVMNVKNDLIFPIYLQVELLLTES